MAIKAVVFDLDGTLIDSRKDIAAAANHMLETHGLERQSVEQICTHVGDGARVLVAGVTGLALDSEAVDGMLDTLLGYYVEHATDQTTMMPGAAEALDALRAMPLGILTNKPRITTDAVVDALDLRRHFDVIVAAGDTPERKPSPEPLRTVARGLNVSASELVMIGDGPQDIECAQRAGAKSVGVKGGILPIDQLERAGPDRLIETLAELPRVIETWGQPS